MRIVDDATERTLRSLMVLVMSVILGSTVVWFTLAYVQVVVSPAAVLALVRCGSRGQRPAICCAPLGLRAVRRRGCRESG